MAVFTQQDVDQLWHDVLKKGRPITLQVVSGSMSPTIDPGDRITVGPLPLGKTLTVGEIVLLREGGNWIVHRIIGRTGGPGSRTGAPGREAPWTFRQKGDAGLRAASVSLESIAGIVVSVEKPGAVIDMTGGRQRFINGLIGRFFCATDRMRSFRDRWTYRPMAGRLFKGMERAVSRLGTRLMRGGRS